MAYRTPISNLPDEWKVAVEVIRGGSRDSEGRVRPPQRILKKHCLIDYRTTGENLDLSDRPNSKYTLFRDHETGFAFETTDQIEIKDGTHDGITFRIDGLIKMWPYGVEIALVA